MISDCKKSCQWPILIVTITPLLCINVPQPVAYVSMEEVVEKTKESLVIIDDDETCHLIFKALIRRIEAFEKIAKGNFFATAIILDINMPRMTGGIFGGSEGN
jgi:hypothetical protein